MELQRATLENNLFHYLEVQWQGQYSDYDENFDDYLSSYREHSRRVIQDSFDNYFVYVLTHHGAHHGFVHVNHAEIKRFSGKTIRALEICLAPKYDYEDISTEEMAKICSSMFVGLYNLSDNKLPADHIKIHMRSLDKDIFAAFSSFYALSEDIEVNIHGTWLVASKKK